MSEKNPANVGSAVAGASTLKAVPVPLKLIAAVKVTVGVVEPAVKLTGAD